MTLSPNKRKKEDNNMFKEKFEHHLSVAKVRQMCIENDYYTAGDCEAYENMFDMFFQKDVTPELLREVARDIKVHSHTEDETFDIVMNLMRLVDLIIVAEQQ